MVSLLEDTHSADVLRPRGAGLLPTRLVAVERADTRLDGCELCMLHTGRDADYGVTRQRHRGLLRDVKVPCESLECVQDVQTVGENRGQVLEGVQLVVGEDENDGERA